MKYYGITDKGFIRKSNQDSYVIATNESKDVLAVVADGIGGNRGGDIASRIAVSVMCEGFSSSLKFNQPNQIHEWLRNTISNANSQIFYYAQSHPDYQGMGTTLCALLVCELGCWFVNIGDSRAYAWFADGRFQQITQDHSYVNDLVRKGEMTLEEAKHSKQKNMLTNALGVWRDVRFDEFHGFSGIQGVLLCSDGLHAYVDEEVIRSILFSNSIPVAKKARRLIEVANRVGGFDNVTAIIVDLRGDDR